MGHGVSAPYPTYQAKKEPNMQDAIVTKRCPRCATVKAVTEFHKDKHTKSGYKSCCKPCGLEMQKASRLKHGERYLARKRERRAANAARVNEADKAYAKANPHKRRAKGKVQKALISGKLTKQPCEVCGTTEKIHAHHTDYSKPLEVMWLCALHHGEWHAKHGPVD